MLAKKPRSSPKRVGRISRKVRGVLETTIFQTCKDACRTTSWVSERPMYSPANTRFRRSTPRAVMIAYRSGKEGKRGVVKPPEHERQSTSLPSPSAENQLKVCTLLDCAVPKLSSSEAVSVVIFPVTPEMWNRRSPSS